MGKNSKIEWTHHTLNLWWGCTNVHRGCDNCYAETWAKRWDNKLWGNDAPRKAIKSAWGNVAKWQAEAEAAGEMHRVFVGSMMDIFEKPMPVVDSKGEPVYSLPGQRGAFSKPIDTGMLRGYFFEEVVPKCPNLMFLLLTKRPSNINKMVPGSENKWRADSWLKRQPDNVMYGASVVDQKSAKDVARAFEKVGGNKFLSVEPLLDSVDLSIFEFFYDCPQPMVNWVIVGGESGPKARPFNADWAREIHRWTREINAYHDKEDHVAFFMKQMGGKKKPFEPIPEDLMIREFPACHELQTA